MAKLLNPLFSTEVRGRVAGIQYNTWRGTRFAKVQTSPAQPRSTRQLQIRAWLAYLVRKWQSIDPASRSNWNAYAVTHTDIDWTNSPKRLTGINWFVRLNIRLLDLAKPEIAEPPSAPAPPALTTFAAAPGSLSATLSWDATADWGDYVDVMAFGPHSAGIAAKVERAVHNSYAQGPSGTAAISGLRPGTYTFWLRVIYQDTGLASPWVSASCVVTL